MKRFLLLLAALAGLLITGCNKNNQDDSLILGSWKGYLRSHIILKNGEPVSPATYLNDMIKLGLMEEPEDAEEWAEAIESVQDRIYDEYLMEGDEDIILRFEKDGKLTSIYEDEEPISQNLAYSIEGDRLLLTDPSKPSTPQTMTIKNLTAKELVLGFNSEDSAVISQSLVAIGYSVYHEITFRKIFLT